MNPLFAIITILGGLVAASSWIVAKQPRARDLFDRLAPFHGATGIALLAIGVVQSIRVAPHLSGLMSTAPIAATITIAAIALDLMLGLLLGRAFVERLVARRSSGKGPDLERLQQKLGPLQAPLGMTAITCGILVMVY